MFINIITLSILGYGIKINYFPYDSNIIKQDKYDMFCSSGKFTNPNITFIINYRWVCFHLLLGRE